MLCLLRTRPAFQTVPYFCLMGSGARCGSTLRRVQVKVYVLSIAEKDGGSCVVSKIQGFVFGVYITCHTYTVHPQCIIYCVIQYNRPTWRLCNVRVLNVVIMHPQAAKKLTKKYTQCDVLIFTLLQAAMQMNLISRTIVLLDKC